MHGARSSVSPQADGCQGASESDAVRAPWREAIHSAWSVGSRVCGVCCCAQLFGVGSGGRPAQLGGAGADRSPAPYSAPQPISGVSCPSASLCVAVDSAGSVVTSTDPLRGPWSIANLERVPPGFIHHRPALCLLLCAVSCPSASLCVAVDGSGNVLTSTNPAGGTGAWTRPRISQPGYDELLAVSCPTVSLCVAGDDSGDVLVSTNPTSPAPWTRFQVNAHGSPQAYTPIRGISCPSAQLCVAVDGAGDVITSTDPTGGSGAWTLSKVEEAPPCNGYGCAGLAGVSCPSSAPCVATDDDGDVVSSTHPTGGASVWTVANVDGSKRLNGISCQSDSLCVAVDNVGNVITSGVPTGGTGSWTAAEVDKGNSISGVSCVAAPLCVAVDIAGNVLPSTDPTGGAGSWEPNNVDGTNPLSAISCPSATLCVAAGGDGHMDSSTNPAGDARAWTVTRLHAANRLDGQGVSCASKSLCVAVDAQGDAISSTRPAGGVGAWSVVHADRACQAALNCLENGLPAFPTGVSCPSVSMCVAIDSAGNAVASSDPTGPASAWTTTPIETSCPPNSGLCVKQLEAISCPSVSLCVAVDGTGHVLTSTRPTKPSERWKIFGTPRHLGVNREHSEPDAVQAVPAPGRRSLSDSGAEARVKRPHVLQACTFPRATPTAPAA